MAHPHPRGGWTAEEELSWPARNGGARTGRGRKLRRRCCAEAVEAKTSFGQISPSPEAVWTRLEQRGRGDQGNPEGPAGETGQAPPAVRNPSAGIRPACASSLICGIARECVLPTGSWSSSAISSSETKLEQAPRRQQLVGPNFGAMNDADLNDVEEGERSSHASLAPPLPRRLIAKVKVSRKAGAELGPFGPKLPFMSSFG